MYKLTLLFIPLLFLSSCAIDWNDEKDTKIAELEKQILQITEQKKEVTKKIQFNKNRNPLSFDDICNSEDGQHNFDMEWWPVTTNGYVKIGTLLFSLRDTDNFPTKTVKNSAPWFIGYRFSFWKYDCITKEHNEIVSENIAQRILETLPKDERKYAPFVYSLPTNYTFFNNTLKFSYVTWNEFSWIRSMYSISIDTKFRQIWIHQDLNTPCIESSSWSLKKEQLFSTGFTY